MASSAIKATFGETKTEPISGAQGDVSRGEPYDAGNLDATEQERIRQSLNTSEGGRDFDSSDAAYTTGTKDATNTSTDFSGNDVPKSANTGTITTATNQRDESGFTHPNRDMTAPGRSDSDEVLAGGVTTATNRTTDSGFTSPGNDMGGTRSNTKLPGTDDRDASADVARGNGGNAATASASETTSASSGNRNNLSPSDGKDSNTTGNDNEGKGTGELYVKSSGLKADGGDFDATKPGAGREADRLMEEKGISATSSASSGKKDSSGSSGGDHDTKSHGSGDSGEKEKHGLVDKIKEKLHKH